MGMQPVVEKWGGVEGCRWYVGGVGETGEVFGASG
jgi:hypothetical protein